MSVHAVTVEKAATLSPCGTYRYTLHRTWDPDLRPLVWVMLNPSTADADLDDPTIRRIVGFTRREGYGRATVLNLYALRSPYTSDLAKHHDPIGPDNDGLLADYGASTFDMVAAWGAHAALRASTVLTGPLFGRRLLCLGKTKDGHPRHPLYVKGDQPFEVFR